MTTSTLRPVELQLLDNVGPGVTGAGFQWPGGQLCLTVENASGGSISLQYKGPSGNWISIAALTSVIGNGLQAGANIPSGQIRAITTVGALGVTLWAIRNVD